MTRLWGEYIRTEHHTLIVPRHLLYFAITVFFILILLFTAFQYVSAETPEQPVQNPLTQDNPVISPQTNTSPPDRPSPPLLTIRPTPTGGPGAVASGGGGGRGQPPPPGPRGGGGRGGFFFRD